MKKLILSVAFIATSLVSFAQVGVGTTNPDASAALDVESTTQGFLPPRMTEAQMNAISAPAEGLMVYCTDCTPKGLYINTTDTSGGDSPSWDNAGDNGSGSGNNTATVVNDCDTNGIAGTFVNGVAVSGASFSVTLTNNTFSTVAINFAAGDVVLSGVSGLTVGAPSPASVSLTAGQSQLVTYPLSGTPGEVGTLTATWSKLSLSCTKTKNVTNGGATFTLPQAATVVSINDGTPLVDLQGVVDNAANQFIVNVPYTAGQGSYDAYTSAVVNNAAGTGEAGDANGFSISYPAGTFSASGTIPVTITVDGDGTFNAKKQLFGVLANIATIDFQVNGNSEGNILLDVVGGVPDRNFADANHKFVYIPVTSAGGKTWLNNNLGANYANLNHASFSPTQQATLSNDANAYGSLYQWGRYSDGHELASTSPVSGTSATATVTGANATRFLFGSSNWYTGASPDALWQGEAGTNNVCPQGYRLPTEAELNTERTSWATNNAAGALNSPLAFPLAGFRDYSNGSLVFVGTYGYYWSSTVSATNARNLNFNSSNANMNPNARANGFSVRCLKE